MTKTQDLAAEHDLALMAAVSGGTLNGNQAAEMRAQRNQQIREHAVLGRFDAAAADGIAAAKTFRSDFRADRETLDVSADEADLLDARMAARIASMQAEADRAQRVSDQALVETRKRNADNVKSMFEVVEATGEFPPAWEAAKLLSDTLDPPLAQAMRQFEDDVGWRKEFKTLPPAEQTTELADLEAVALAEESPRAREALAARLKDGRKMMADIAKAAAKAPLATYEATGASEPTPLDAANKESFSARANAALAADRHWGLPEGTTPPFHAAEVVRITDAVVATDDIRQKLSIVRAYVSQWPDVSTRRKALDQLTRDGDLPDAYGTAMDILGDKPDEVDRGRAERILGELLTDPAKAGLDPTDAKDIRTKAETAYDSARGEMWAKAGAYNPALAAVLDRERGEVVTVAGARKLAGVSKPVDAAIADLYGREQVIVDDRLAFVPIPADADRSMVRRGLTLLRGQGADALAGQAPPGLDRMGRLTFAKTVEQTRAFGVWTPNADGYSLIVPKTQRPVAGPDGKPWVVTLDEVLAAGAVAPPERLPSHLPYGR